MKTKISPLGENILIDPLKANKKTNSGLYLPENVSEEKPQEGKVIAIGDSKDIKVKKGQRVVFNRFGGIEVDIENDEYLIVKNEDILAVIS